MSTIEQDAALSATLRALYQEYLDLAHDECARRDALTDAVEEWSELPAARARGEGFLDYETLTWTSDATDGDTP